MNKADAKAIERLLRLIHGGATTSESLWLANASNPGGIPRDWFERLLGENDVAAALRTITPGAEAGELVPQQDTGMRALVEAVKKGGKFRTPATDAEAAAIRTSGRGAKNMAHINKMLENAKAAKGSLSDRGGWVRGMANPGAKMLEMAAGTQGPSAVLSALSAGAEAEADPRMVLNMLMRSGILTEPVEWGSTPRSVPVVQEAKASKPEIDIDDLLGRSKTPSSLSGGIWQGGLPDTDAPGVASMRGAGMAAQEPPMTDAEAVFEKTAVDASKLGKTKLGKAVGGLKKAVLSGPVMSLAGGFLISMLMNKMMGNDPGPVTEQEQINESMRQQALADKVNMYKQRLVQSEPSIARTLIGMPAMATGERLIGKPPVDESGLDDLMMIHALTNNPDLRRRARPRGSAYGLEFM